ncbi:group II intron maturase-specific domain-containing protein [Streptomyces cucumeris]|uniref:group II intron maturase-specific domain-containing protein n=1 Tax=Streptomyces cucumeris TaxID=2962890 RepID=UPI003D7115CF
MGEQVRSWQLHTRTGLTLNELARRINPIVAGWIAYYGRFHRTQLNPLLTRINAYLVRWARRKFKRLAPLRKAIAKMQEIARRYPGLFAHWRYVTASAMTW